MSLRRFLPVLAVVLVALPPSFAHAGTIGLGESYNVLVFGNFSATSSDVEGRLAAGGNVSLNHYSVGDKLTGDMVGGASLVVGGNLTFPSGRVYHGDIVVGGSAAGVGSPVLNGLAPYALQQGGPLPIDFAAEQARLGQLSTGLAALGATGTSLYQWSQLFLTGDGTSDLQIFNIAAADLAASTNLVISGVAAGTDVIINVSGTAASMSGGMDQFFTQNREHVLFNFYEAETLSLANVGVQGSILAPDADIQTNWGVIWGQVVGESWSGPMQVNNVTYSSELPVGGPPGGNVVPAPASLALLGTGLVLLAWFVRRRATT